MARIIKTLLSDVEWHGPFPNRAGEFCGNVPRESITLEEDGITVAKHHWSLASLKLGRTAKLRIGKPANSNIASIGLYLVEDQPAREDEEEVDTDIFFEEVISGERFPRKPLCLHRDEGL